jgi:Tfp pilus assembly protein PilN
MSYSFIDTRPKSPISSGVRKVWFAGAFLLILLIAAYVILHMYSRDERKGLAQKRTVQETIGLQIEQLKEQMAQYEVEKRLRQQTYTANQLQADQLADLLDLIPDDTTLSRFELDGVSVFFEGVCRDFDTLKTDLTRALSGQYLLSESRQSVADGQRHFTMRFKQIGAGQ